MALLWKPPFGTFIFKSVDLSWFLKPFSEEFQHILTVKKCEEHFINLKNLFLEWKVSMDLHGTKDTNNLYLKKKKLLYLVNNKIVIFLSNLKSYFYIIYFMNKLLPEHLSVGWLLGCSE